MSNSQNLTPVTLLADRNLFGFTRAQDLSRDDMLVLYGLLKDEALFEVFFHDWPQLSFSDFLAYAKSPATWFYAVNNNGPWGGFITLNNFSSSGACAFLHACAFNTCRGQAAVRGMINFLNFIGQHSQLQSVVAFIPKPYRAARKLLEACGFAELARLPQAMRIYRKGHAKNVDGCLFAKTLNKKSPPFCSTRRVA